MSTAVIILKSIAAVYCEIVKQAAFDISYNSQMKM